MSGVLSVPAFEDDSDSACPACEAVLDYKAARCPSCGHWLSSQLAAVLHAPSPQASPEPAWQDERPWWRGLGGRLRRG